MSAAQAQRLESYEVTVQLKAEVLDPEGRAIQETLARVGFEAIKGVTVSKRYLLKLDAAGADLAGLVDQVAREYLTNPVSETYQVRKL